jgi:type I restriction enzyme S subunit
MINIKEGLPNIWEKEKLGDFVISQKGKKPKNQKTTSDDRYVHPYVDIEAFEKNIIKSYADGKNCIFCSEGDFLMVWDGSRSGLVGKGMKGALGSTLVRINFPGINNNYAYYFLKSKYQEINTRAKGSGTPHVDPDLLWNYNFPIAPINEQARIVDKIEELFSELDKGIESLKTAKTQLAIYRQALLKHAFEGKLTEQWRKDNADHLESPEQLLTRIQQEREGRYKQQLDDWQTEVEQWEIDDKEGKKPSKPTKIIPITNLTDCNHINIPNSWQLFSYGDLCSVVRNGISKKPVGSDGIKIFRISAVRALSFNMDDYRFINNESGEFNNFYLQQGDIVFTRYNGSRRYVGVCAQYNSEEPRLFPDKLVQTRPNLPSIHMPFLEKTLNSGFSRRFVESRIRTTAGQSGVSGTDIKQIPVPVCSIEEQIEINAILEAKLSVIESMEKETDINLKKSELLRQSILKKAFSGQLVAQEPTDEPASELLKKIAIEKAEFEIKEKAEKSAEKKAKAEAKKAKA